MSNSPLEPEILLSRLSRRPRYLLGAMITITDPPKRPNSTLPERVSTLGTIDCLPPEIMSIILCMLDIQSIARFASVSFRGNAFVQSQRAYRDLVAFVPQVLLALGRTGLIHLHSVTKLHAALRMERCATCAEYGAFLFLPTGERCCWECLRYNPLLRVILPRQAKRYFALSERHLQCLPTLHPIPGNYDIFVKSPPEHCELVSVKAARDLGLKVHGSAEKLAQAMAKRCKSRRFIIIGRYLQSRPPIYQGQDLLLQPSQGNIPPDDYFGMASIPFPSISKPGEIEDGLWCRGCEVTRHQYDSLRLPRDVLVAVVPLNCEPEQVLVGLERRARSKESFLNHIKHCYGARQLVPELASGND
ncbi:F-box domain-containing protein [Hypoxylon sp. FL1857]|nr:F-box domain-containing protein [Hypoxylon sp. FL1857]